MIFYQLILLELIKYGNGNIQGKIDGLKLTQNVGW